MLPQNYQLTLDKLKNMPHLSKDIDKLKKLISTSLSTKINGKIITFCVVKLSYNKHNNALLRLLNLLTELTDSTDAKNWLQQVQNGTYIG